MRASRFCYAIVIFLFAFLRSVKPLSLERPEASSDAQFADALESTSHVSTSVETANQNSSPGNEAVNGNRPEVTNGVAPEEKDAENDNSVEIQKRVQQSQRPKYTIDILQANTTEPDLTRSGSSNNNNTAPKSVHSIDDNIDTSPKTKESNEKDSVPSNSENVSRFLPQQPISTSGSRTKTNMGTEASVPNAAKYADKSSADAALPSDDDDSDEDGSDEEEIEEKSPKIVNNGPQDSPPLLNNSDTHETLEPMKINDNGLPTQHKQVAVKNPKNATIVPGGNHVTPLVANESAAHNNQSVSLGGALSAKPEHNASFAPGEIGLAKNGTSSPVVVLTPLENINDTSKAPQPDHARPGPDQARNETHEGPPTVAKGPPPPLGPSSAVSPRPPAAVIAANHSVAEPTRGTSGVTVETPTAAKDVNAMPPTCPQQLPSETTKPKCQWKQQLSRQLFYWNPSNRHVEVSLCAVTSSVEQCKVLCESIAQCESFHFCANCIDFTCHLLTAKEATTMPLNPVLFYVDYYEKLQCS